MAERFDLVRLAELRDAHAEKVATYRRSGDQVRDAATAAARARMDAPTLPGDPPAVHRHALPPGMVSAAPRGKVRPRTNEFYLQPLAVLKVYTQDELTTAGVDHRAFSRIVAAETRLERLRVEHAAHGQAVKDSATFMRGINLFSLEKQL